MEHGRKGAERTNPHKPCRFSMQTHLDVQLFRSCLLSLWSRSPSFGFRAAQSVSVDVCSTFDWTTQHQKQPPICKHCEYLSNKVISNSQTDPIKGFQRSKVEIGNGLVDLHGGLWCNFRIWHLGYDRKLSKNMAKPKMAPCALPAAAPLVIRKRFKLWPQWPSEVAYIVDFKLLCWVSIKISKVWLTPVF